MNTTIVLQKVPMSGKKTKTSSEVIILQPKSKDMQSGREGGTWFAVRTGKKCLRLGTLLNITGAAPKPNCPGRGSVVTNYVKSNASTIDYLTEIKSKSQSYNAFNFVTAEITEDNCSVSCTNSETKITQEWITDTAEAKTPIKIGVGNSTFDKPFKKVTEGLKSFPVSNRSTDKRDSLIEDILKFLQSREKHWPDEVLSARNPLWGEHLSSIYVESIGEKYGTRTHTIVLLDYNWRLDFIDMSLKIDDSSNCKKWVKNHFTKYLNCN